MENKKISFSFSKITKKTELFPKPKHDKPLELIDCFEDQAIKVKGGSTEIEVKPLVIPLVGSSNELVDQIKKTRERNKEEVKSEVEEKPDSELTIEELAARELIRESQNRDSVKVETKVFSVPLKKEEDKFVAEGANEPSLNDYESVPIADYGMAMLRGMNWEEGMPIGKRGKKVEAPKMPELRPRGLGLGANKLVNLSKPAENNTEEELKLVKGCFCKIIAGNHRGHYCQVQGFDDESYKVIVKTSITNEVLSLNEFLIVPVSKEEYANSSRVINNAKFEAYKESSRRRTEASRSRSRSPECSHKSRKSKNKAKKRKHKSHSLDKDKKKHKHKRSRRDSSSDSDHRRRGYKEAQ